MLRARTVRRSWRPWLRGTALGFPFGAMPTGGAEIPTFLSYATEKRLARKAKEEFGTGAIEGVAGPEAANNAAFSGVLVPLLTLGIPTSATAAILVAAFQIFDLQPGPQLFTKQPDLVWALIASLYVGNVMLLALNLPLVRLWVKVLEIPRELLYGGILVFATLGVYSVTGSVDGVLVMYLIGVLGFFMRRFDFPVAPVILGVILGPLMEAQFRRTLLVSDGDFGAFLERPFAVVLFVLAILALVVPVAASSVRRVRGWARRTEKGPRRRGGVVGVDPLDRLEREVGRAARHARVALLLVGPVGQVEAALVLGRHRLDLRGARHAGAARSAPAPRDVRAVEQAGRERRAVLEALRGALGHEGQHRVTRIAQQCAPALRPARQRRAVEQRPDERLVDRSDDRVHLRVPALERGERVPDLAAIGPRLARPGVLIEDRDEVDQPLARTK